MHDDLAVRLDLAMRRPLHMPAVRPRMEPTKIMAFSVEIVADPVEIVEVAIWDPIQLVLERFAFSQ